MEQIDEECLTLLRGSYVLLSKVGEGGFGDVWHARHSLSSEDVAIKIMPRDKIDEIGGLREAKVLLELNHGNICKLYEVLESKSYYMMVVEFCPGGELFELVITEKRIDERRARRFMRQLVSALLYMNERSFSHRDLKLENMLLDENGDVKLIDFGLCARKNPRKPYFETFCGTAAFAAPEILNHIPYKGTNADVFSLGVCLYILVCGRLPFREPGEKENLVDYFRTQWKRLQNPLPFKESLNLTADLKNLLNQMLRVDPQARISLVGMRKHPWLDGGGLQPIDTRGDAPIPTDCARVDLQLVRKVASHHHTTCNGVMMALQIKPAGRMSADYKILVKRKSNKPPAGGLATVDSTTYKKLIESHKAKVGSPCFHESFTDRHNLNLSFSELLPENNEVKKTPVRSGVNPLRERQVVRGGEGDNNMALLLRTEPVNHLKRRRVTPAALYNTPNPAPIGEKKRRLSKTGRKTPRHSILCGGGRYRSLEDISDTGSDGSTKMTPYAKIVNLFGSVKKGIRSSVKRVGRRVKDVNIVPVPRYTSCKVLLHAARSILHKDLDMLCSSKAEGSGEGKLVATLYAPVSDTDVKAIVTLQLEAVIIESIGCVGIRRKRLKGDTLLYSKLMRQLLTKLGVLQEPIECELDTLV